MVKSISFFGAAAYMLMVVRKRLLQITLVEVPGYDEKAVGRSNLVLVNHGSSSSASRMCAWGRI